MLKITDYGLCRFIQHEDMASVCEDYRYKGSPGQEIHTRTLVLVLDVINKIGTKNYPISCSWQKLYFTLNM